MRISDWSSDVCASDLLGVEVAGLRCHGEAQLGQAALRRPELLVLDEADKLAERGPGGIQHLGQRLGAWPALLGFLGDEIGRAPCRERVCQYVVFSVGAVSLKKQQIRHNKTREP